MLIGNCFIQATTAAHVNKTTKWARANYSFTREDFFPVIPFTTRSWLETKFPQNGRYLIYHDFLKKNKSTSSMAQKILGEDADY